MITIASIFILELTMGLNPVIVAAAIIIDAVLDWGTLEWVWNNYTVKRTDGEPGWACGGV